MTVLGKGPGLKRAGSKLYPSKICYTHNDFYFDETITFQKNNMRSLMYQIHCEGSLVWEF